MWIDAEAPHKKAVNTFAFDSLYISRLNAYKWQVCASVGSNDFVIKTCDTETIANQEFTQLLTKIKADKP